MAANQCELSRRCYDDRIPLEPGRDSEAAIARQYPSIERLDGMGVNWFGRDTSQEIDGGGRQAGIEPASGDPIALAHWIGGQCAAARDSAARDQEHVEEKFDPVLADERTRQIPGQRGLTVLKKSAGGFLCIAKLDLRAGGSGGAKGQTAKLKLGRGLAGALFNQVEGKGLRFFILICLRLH